MAHLFWLSDEAWAAIEPHLARGKPGKPRVDDRRVISGILHVLKSGCRWRDCPRVYGPPTTIYNRLQQMLGARCLGEFVREDRRLRTHAGQNSASTARTSKRIARQLAEKKGREPSDRALARRPDKQNPCFGR